MGGDLQVSFEPFFSKFDYLTLSYYETISSAGFSRIILPLAFPFFWKIFFIFGKELKPRQLFELVIPEEDTSNREIFEAENVIRISKMHSRASFRAWLSLPSVIKIQNKVLDWRKSISSFDKAAQQIRKRLFFRRSNNGKAPTVKRRQLCTFREMSWACKPIKWSHLAESSDDKKVRNRVQVRIFATFL